MLLDVTQSLLLIIDAQERLMPTIAHHDRLIDRMLVLLRSAAELGVPVMATEQYPKGLGHTIPAIAAQLEGHPVLEKTAFSATEEPGLEEQVRAFRRPQIVIAGVEAHICVLQTAIGLQARGYTPLVIADAVGSRQDESKDIALHRLKGCGIVVATVEMVAFEWLRRAGTDAFKRVSKLIR